jgi:hypothetical protein
MGRPPSLGLTFYFYLVIFIANVTGVTENWIATGFCPVLPLTTKAAPISSTVQGAFLIHVNEMRPYVTSPTARPEVK